MFYGTLEELKKRRIWAPMFELMYYLAIPRSEFLKMGRKEMEYHFMRLKETMEAHRKAGSPGKDVVAANDPTVQALLPNPSGRPHVNPRTHRI
jgi:hypothetical protein